MRLAAVGSNCIDFYKEENNEGTPYPGGGPVNMAVYTVRLGGEAAYIGHVGNDPYGKFMVDSIEKKGVDTSHLYVKEGKTAVTQVLLKDGERVFDGYDEGVLADYKLTEEDMQFIRQFDVVICDLWGKVEGQYKDLKEMGMVTAFDCATNPEAKECQVAIPFSDYVFFSSDDGDSEVTRKRMKEIKAQGPKLVVCMLGSEGSLCYDGENFHKFGIIPCENLVDTMGAGDSYISGFLFGITEGLSIEEAMEKGAANAKVTLEYSGAW